MDNAPTCYQLLKLFHEEVNDLYIAGDHKGAFRGAVKMIAPHNPTFLQALGHLHLATKPDPFGKRTPAYNLHDASRVLHLINKLRQEGNHKGSEELIKRLEDTAQQIVQKYTDRASVITKSSSKPRKPMGSLGKVLSTLRDPESPMPVKKAVPKGGATASENLVPSELEDGEWILPENDEDDWVLVK